MTTTDPKDKTDHLFSFVCFSLKIKNLELSLSSVLFRVFSGSPFTTLVLISED